MKKIASLFSDGTSLLRRVDFLTCAFFISGVYAIVYMLVLQSLNAVYKYAPTITFIRSGASPEPFEIPLYLGMSLLLASAIGLAYKKQVSQKLLIFPPIVRLFLFVCSFLFFIYMLGSYPMYRDFFPYPEAEAPFVNIAVSIAYCALVVFLIAEVYIFSRLIKRNGLRLSVIYSTIFIAIAILTFEPRFPIVGHDYSYFLGPVWEIVSGKTIYTDVPSQYGFVSILLLSIFQTLHIFNIAALPVLVWVLYIVQYMGVFFIVHRISRSVTLAILCVFSVIAINYFSLFHLPATIPQVGPFRWLPLIFAIVLFIWRKNLAEWRFILPVSFLSTLMLDSGIALMLAFSTTLWLLFIKGEYSLQKCCIVICRFILSLIAIFAIINTGHVLLGYKPINVFIMFGKISQYAKAGFGMIAITQVRSFFWLYIFAYILAIILFFRTKKNTTYTTTVLFTANIALFAGVYYVGRSHVHNLFHISLFLLLVIFLFFSKILRNFSDTMMRVVLFVVIGLFFIVLPAYSRQEVLAKQVVARIELYKKGEIFTPEWLSMLSFKYRDDIAMIQRESNSEKIVILSADDTYLFYLTGKKNYLYDNSQFTILTQEDIDHSLKDVYKTCPKKIFADCTLFGKCIDSNPFTITYFNLQPILLDNIQKNCSQTYMPTKCTRHLCVATIQNKQKL